MATHLKRFVAIFALSWLVSAATIAGWLYRTSIEDFTLADMIPFWIILGVAGLLVSAICSMPLLLLLRRRFGLTLKAFVYPLVNTLLVGSLVAAIAYSLAYTAGNLSVGEAGLFTAAFLSLSLTFGLGFSAFYRARERKN
jgi:hypothetical protein